MLESANGDIQLVVEAFRLPENPMHEGDKYGEAVFDVFPRRGKLFSAVRQSTPSTKDSNELYKFDTNIVLNQVQEGEGFWTRCGTIRAAVQLLHEEDEQASKSIFQTVTCSFRVMFSGLMVNLWNDCFRFHSSVAVF